jgi:hypothetical protein
MNMFRKLTIAVAIAASLGTALAPSIASAKGFGGFGGHHSHFGGFGIVGAIAAGAVAADVAEESCFVTQRVMTPYGYRMRTINVCND